MTTKHLLFDLCAVLLFFTACEPKPVTIDQQPTDTVASLKGMYILNEGGFNMNNASLDYLDFATGRYTLDTFALANPSIGALGDVANDILVYGTKTYIAVNGSGLIEVIDTYSAKHIAKIDIPNCRRLCAANGVLYVSSYAGRVIDDQHQLGYVAQIDTTTLTVTETCEVGYQPEGLAVVDGKLYVANCGGYVGMNIGEYDNRLSVIDLVSFTLTEHIEIAPNLQEIVVDSRQNLWISSYGNYADIASDLYCLNTQTKQVTAQGVPVTKMVSAQDTITILATTYDENWNSVTTFAQLATVNGTLLPLTLSLPSSSMPNALGINPANGDIYVTDAKDYVNPGKVYCFQSNGNKKWELHTGIIPAHFAFVF